MNQFVATIAEIPEAVWGAMVGAVIALAGVGVQLWHDRRERERERRFDAKKDVYVEAAEALASAQAFLSGFARTDVPIAEQLSTLQGNPGWLNKLHIFAGHATLSAVTAAGDYFTDAAADLASKRFALETLSWRLKERERERDQLTGHQQQLQAHLQALTSQPPGTPTWGHVPHLWNMVQQAQQRLDTLFREIDDLIERRLERHIKLTELALHHASEFQRTLVAANTEIRKEVSDPLELKAYAALVENSAKVREEALKRMIADLKKLSRD